MLKKIILVNMTGAALESLGDLLDMWGYMPIKVEAAETISALALVESSSLIMFQFLEFSEAEYELLRTLQERGPKIPIVATSPFISVRDIFRIVRSGIADYLVQPYLPQDLQQLLYRQFNTGTASESKGVHKSELQVS